MLLNKHDRVRVGYACAFFFIATLSGWTLWGGIGLAILLSVTLGSLLILQLELYRKMGASGKHKHPPCSIPPYLMDRYTLGGRIPVEEFYLDDMRSPDHPIIYKKTHIDALIRKVQKRTLGYYGETDAWLYQALDKYSIRGREVVIIGSTTPWYESICLYYGGRCTTIEYNKIVSRDSRLTAMTPGEYDRSPRKFGAALSASSIEHDGLGRYGDPLNPEGDLEAMRKLRNMLEPRGLLFLSVPVGQDTLAWNAHRIYGKLRLPMLLRGWRIVETFGFNEAMLEQATEKGRRWVEPIFVFENYCG